MNKKTPFECLPEVKPCLPEVKLCYSFQELPEDTDTEAFTSLWPLLLTLFCVLDKMAKSTYYLLTTTTAVRKE